MRSGCHHVLGHVPGTSDEILAENELIVAVRGVNLSVSRGEIFVIMGLSGSGKSTLVQCMTGLVDPTRGRLLIDGTDLMNIAPRDLVQVRRFKMGMVFQDFALLPYLTVLGNVVFPLKIQGVDRSKREARAREMIELVGLDGRERYYPHELSGGQQQRVGIARSLTTEPEIWFLDEPFSALDPLIRHEMQDELQRLQGILEKTIVFIAHDFDEAIKLADLPKWARYYRRDWKIPADKKLTEWFKFLAEELDLGLFTFLELTRGSSWIVAQFLKFMQGLLGKGFEFYGDAMEPWLVIPQLPWIAVTGIFCIVAYWASGRALAIMVGAFLSTSLPLVCGKGRC